MTIDLIILMDLAVKNSISILEYMNIKHGKMID